MESCLRSSKNMVTAPVRDRGFGDIFLLVQDGGVSKIRAEHAFCMGHALSQVPKTLEACKLFVKMHFREAFVRILSYTVEDAEHQLPVIKIGKAVPPDTAPAATWRIGAERTAPILIEAFMQYTEQPGVTFGPPFHSSARETEQDPQQTVCS